MGLWKYVAISPFIFISGHTAFVSAHNATVKRASNSADVEADYKTGSTNNMILDNMNSGDVILFRRRWFFNYLPVSISFVLYRLVSGSEFDHLGVVILDKYGSPWIVENTPFEGLQCLKLSDRLKENDSEIVAMLPLVPRREKSVTFENVGDWTNALASTPNELSSMIQFSTSILYRVVFGGGISENEKEMCPNALLFKQNMDLLGIRTRYPAHYSVATIKDIEDGNVDLKSKDQLSKSKISLSTDYVLLQTR